MAVTFIFQALLPEFPYFLFPFKEKVKELVCQAQLRIAFAFVGNSLAFQNI